MISKLFHSVIDFFDTLFFKLSGWLDDSMPVSRAEKILARQEKALEKELRKASVNTTKLEDIESKLAVEKDKLKGVQAEYDKIIKAIKAGSEEYNRNDAKLALMKVHSVEKRIATYSATVEKFEGRRKDWKLALQARSLELQQAREELKNFKIEIDCRELEDGLKDVGRVKVSEELKKCMEKVQFGFRVKDHEDELRKEIDQTTGKEEESTLADLASLDAEIEADLQK
ncbi:MAG: hypothetical protein J6Y62_07090 [Clostridia bacterium]|nr:hypothetical protein [Clostridia bacterium]